jgi:deazaflavin-dependent oxidoreductase (nitroreductase family)
MAAAERKRNPFITSATGGRLLSALQLPLFLLRPPAGYAVLTTTGRRTGKTRRRCIRAIHGGDRVYLVAIKGAGTTGWAKNALANPDVRLRLPGGTFSGRAREPQGESEITQAASAYCETVKRFDYLTYMNWRKGRPTPAGIRELLRGWFDQGTPLIVDLDG